MKKTTITTPEQLDAYIASIEEVKGWGPALDARRKFLAKTSPEFRLAYAKAFFAEGLIQALQEGQFYARVCQVSPSGMSRHISLWVPYIDHTGTIRIENLTYLLHHFCGYRWNKETNAVIVGGCGMDMIFHTIDMLLYSLALPSHSPEGVQRASDYRII